MPSFSEYYWAGRRGHLIGVGGVSMSPLAEVLAEAGLVITGSDMNEANPKLEAASDEEAVKIFRKEKRKEFCFEDIRWFDIRRWGLAVEHVYQNINNKEVYETYVLEAESPNYVLSLPMDLQRRNDKIEQAQRVETIVKN